MKTKTYLPRYETPLLDERFDAISETERFEFAAFTRDVLGEARL